MHHRCPSGQLISVASLQLFAIYRLRIRLRDEACGWVRQARKSLPNLQLASSELDYGLHVR